MSELGLCIENHRSYHKLISVTSVAVWVPHSILILYTILQPLVFGTELSKSIHRQYLYTNFLCTYTNLTVLFLLLLSVPVTSRYLALNRSPEATMVFSLLVGILYDLLGFGYQAYDTHGQVPDFLWYGAAIAQGAFGAILSRGIESKCDTNTGITSMMSIVRSFSIGLLLAFAARGGIAAIADIYATVYNCEAIIGLGLITHNLILSHANRKDPIKFIVDFVSSTPPVVLGLLIPAILCTGFLLACFLKSLWLSNTLFSTLGIITELIVYRIY